MIISEKQIHRLISIAESYFTTLIAKRIPGDDEYLDSLAKFLDQITRQQSDELKVVE